MFAILFSASLPKTALYMLPQARQTTKFTRCARSHSVGERARPRSPRVVDARQTGRLFGRAQRGDLRQIHGASSRGFRVKTVSIVRRTMNFG